MIKTHRIEIFTKVNDTKSKVTLKRLQGWGFNIKEIKVGEVYTINKELEENNLEKIAQMLTNPVTQTFIIDDYEKDIDFDFVMEIGFLPGVTDNVASTAKESIEDLLKTSFQKEESIHFSTIIFIKGNTITKEIITKVGETIANQLIQRVHIKSREEFLNNKGMDVIVPKVKLSPHPTADEVNLDISKNELIKLGKEGIKDEDGSRRGPLALDNLSLQAISKYFDKEKRNPRDIELESIAQTWSEHCKHTIFASEIDDIEGGLYDTYIKGATKKIRRDKGQNDFCVSVFSDNAGGILFDENWVITDKAETHNSPSALDPFGGAITGIVGVNRDTIGFGKGAKPIINKYGFCVGEPNDTKPIYRDKELKNKLLSPKRILRGLIEGVNAGGNESGIPTPQGFLYFDKRYKGKPLVFVGTVGLIPKEINGQNTWEKGAKQGDKIVIIGGRVGQDGIHGATFSSEALSSGSPATAVQIGDPITQKKLSDALVKEARDKNLYNSITDNGAGGLSCSVAEMAKECGGCYVELNKVPLKYPNLEPWKIWISESQERMTLAIPPNKLKEFEKLMKKHDVEMSVIGEFNNSGRCQVNFNKEMIMDMDMHFLHDGIPKKKLKTTPIKKINKEPEFETPLNLTETLHKILERPNICSYDFISYQYDYNVQGGTVIGPLQGKGKINGNASITKPLFNSNKGVICSQGLNPNYSDINSYHMASCAIDTAIRNVIAIGGTIDHLAIMDNFCWCSSNDPEKLAELKETAKSCYTYAVDYGTPFISGKDSMFNDFTGYDKDGNPIKISIPPTLLISSMGVMKNVTKAVSIDPKFPDDLVYIIGETKNELGASEYFRHVDKGIGNNIPKVDSKTAKDLYQRFEEATNKRLIASAISPAIGGLAISLTKMAIAGDLGLELDLNKIPKSENLNRDDYTLFSETQSRFIVTIDQKKQKEFEKIFKDTKTALIGKTTKEKTITIKGLNNKTIIKSDIQNLNNHYRKTFKDF